MIQDFYCGKMMKVRMNEIKLELKNELNDIFKVQKLLYLVDDKYKFKYATTDDVLNSKNEEIIANISIYEIQTEINKAIRMYKDFHPDSIDAALKFLWGAYENIKNNLDKQDTKDSVNILLKKIEDTSSIDFRNKIEDEMKIINHFGNNYSIRHISPKQNNIDNTELKRYYFNRCLSLSLLLVDYLI